ncbi:MAG: hypothetical protein VX278_10620 [Myxococcota bacterium]|nr:hypothetical protein [Myxococcota bacterium]
MRNLSLGAIRKHKTIYWGEMGCPPQRWMSHSYSREHTYRRVSVTLKRRRSLLLQTPRWSGGQDFILQLRREMPGSIYIPIRFPPSAQLFESWLYFLEEFRRYCSLPREELLQVVAERKGFRWKIIDILRTLSEQQVSVLFFDQLERWPLSIVEDLQLAWIQV